ncbi:hypothetical protein CCMA1212_000179 [Trichoderma ghanense]|uniref:Uncharacterized protein n=1 Tax=Trichoderma ghanense TaxID=65468 RepID=A0ABY2HIP5_9HYPO
MRDSTHPAKLRLSIFHQHGPRLAPYDHSTRNPTPGWLLGLARVPLLSPFPTLFFLCYFSSSASPCIGCHLSRLFFPSLETPQTPGFALATGRVRAVESFDHLPPTTTSSLPEQREIPRHVCYMSLQKRTCTRTHRSHESAVLSSHMVSPTVCTAPHGSVAGVDRNSTTVICSYLASLVRLHAWAAGSTGQVPKIRRTVLWEKGR